MRPSFLATKYCYHCRVTIRKTNFEMLEVGISEHPSWTLKMEHPFALIYNHISILLENTKHKTTIITELSMLDF